MPTNPIFIDTTDFALSTGSNSPDIEIGIFTSIPATFVFMIASIEYRKVSVPEACIRWSLIVRNSSSDSVTCSVVKISYSLISDRFSETESFAPASFSTPKSASTSALQPINATAIIKIITQYLKDLLYKCRVFIQNQFC